MPETLTCDLCRRETPMSYRHIVSSSGPGHSGPLVEMVVKLPRRHDGADADVCVHCLARFVTGAITNLVSDVEARAAVTS